MTQNTDNVQVEQQVAQQTSPAQASVPRRTGTPTHKHFILALVVLLVLPLAIDRVGGRILRSLMESSQFRYSRLYRGGMINDALFFGDSRGAASFFVPSLNDRLKTRSMNLSLNGLPTIAQEVLLMDYLDHNQAPKMVVIEITSLCQPVGPAAEFLRPYFSSSERVAKLCQNTDPTFAVAMQVSHLLPFNNETLMRAMYYRNRSDQGWISHSKVSQDILDFTNRMPEGDAFTIVPANLEALVRMQDEMSSRGIQIRFVIGPYLPAMRQRMRDMDRFRMAVEKALGDTVWDFSLALDDLAMFADRVHTNELGADKLTDVMIQSGMFQDPR